MTDANYQKHLKVLGKLCKLWDDAGSDEDTQKELIARMFDQAATGELPSYPALLILNPYTAALDRSIVSGVVAQQATAKSMAEAYLKSSTFTDDLTTSVTGGVTGTTVLNALQTEMGAGEDNKTLTTSAATGFVNFFDTNWSPTGSWNTEADATADYKDSVYVVSTIV